ncbi:MULTISPECIES: hypothetical protein [Haloferax]|uniref:Uncharacterized protein n=1 Tax=Haloferax marinum TaxID=2666143 RepID=A0A6A8GBB8_9EURY|nr:MULTISPECIES: hypothetical protein [Haloferax]KAB1190667.1 hypothetical protein Hfx1150_16650 [Haloferax sp. CBA1150]MRW98197.1 hypothetical protein [Haloferax marinum]
MNAFADRLWRVVGGFVLFVAGYRTMQYGVYGWPSMRELTGRDSTVSEALKQAGGLVASIVLSSYGFVLMGRAVDTQSIQPMILSGGTVVLGYILGHVAVNDEVL